MKSIIAAAFLLQASSVPVEVGKFNPTEFPKLVKVERRMPHGDMITRVEKILNDGECRIQGQSGRHFDITVPYAVLMQSGGRAQKVVVGEIGCKPIELLVGQVVVAQAARGDFRVQRGLDEQWYASELNFSLGVPSVGRVASADEDKMICKRGKPQLGTRTKIVKECRTASQWQAYETDRQQLQRDLNNTVCRPGGGGC